MKKIKKKIRNVLFLCVMILGMSNGMKVSANAATESEYDIYVITQERQLIYVTAENKDDVLEDGGSVRYVPASASEPRKMIFTNASLGEVAQYDDGIGVSDNSLLQIVFNGDNEFYTGSDVSSTCIGADAPLEVTGTGKVTMRNDYYNAETEEGFGCIMSEQSLTIRGVEINATAADYSNAIYAIGNLEIKDGAKITANTSNYPGLWSKGDMTITDSTVTVVSSEGNGMWCDGHLTIGGTSMLDVTANEYWTGIGTNAGLEIGGSAQVRINSCWFGLHGEYYDADSSMRICDSAQVEILSCSSGFHLWAENALDIEISDAAVVNITGEYGMWNESGGAISITGGDVTVYGSEYAFVGKPDLSQYTNAVIVTGDGEDVAIQVEESESYNNEHYVRIQPLITLAGHNLVLGELIGVNFHFELAEKVDFTDVYVKLSMDGGDTKCINVADVTDNQEGRKVFTYKVAAKDMKRTITACFYDAQDIKLFETDYSVAEYKKEVLEDENSRDETKDMVTAMITYGEFAAAYFDEDETPNVTLTPKDDIIVNLSEKILSTDGSKEYIRYAGSSLILLSNTTMRIYFELLGETIIGNVNFSGNDSEPKAFERNGKIYYYVDVEDITPKNLDNGITITAAVSENDYTVTLTPLYYVRKMLDGGTQDEKLINLLRALYDYYKIADGYNS